ncbi:hypothetical protein HAX54_026116 [Datura stramonium]|uniref:Uncharacterized protein n=1 Tax=Datura stramonium TaxID=4076 RepID=A0ABS8V0Z5_DATST|nr:hypothetical protein [Datura stramonium]
MVSLNEQTEDCITWNGQQDGNFTIKACCKVLDVGELALSNGHGNKSGSLELLKASYGGFLTMHALHIQSTEKELLFAADVAATT